MCTHCHTVMHSLMKQVYYTVLTEMLVLVVKTEFRYFQRTDLNEG